MWEFLIITGIVVNSIHMYLLNRRYSTVFEQMKDLRNEIRLVSNDTSKMIQTITSDSKVIN